MKKFLSILILTILLISNNSFAINDSDLVKVGLKYEDTAVTNVQITGLNIYYGETLLNGNLININPLLAGNYLEIICSDNNITQLILNDYLNSYVDYSTKNIILGPYDDQNLLEIQKNEITSKFNSLVINTKIIDSNLIHITDGIQRIADFSYANNLNSNEITMKYLERNYRGDFKFNTDSNGKLIVVNILPINEYLYGVLPREMAKDWPLEALKAQALSARTYLYKNMGKFSSYGFDICSTTSCQVYGGYDYEGPISNQAVDETINDVILYNNELINAYYHSSSGGWTENSENVWTSKIPYLIGKEDPYSIDAPNANWTLIYSGDMLSEKLISAGYNIDEVLHVQIDSISPNKRVQKITFNGTALSVTLEKEGIRRVLGTTIFKSIYYDVSIGNKYKILQSSGETESNLNGKKIITSKGLSNITENSNYILLSKDTQTTIQASKVQFFFSGHGYGHGIGMSQWGAYNMANLGFNYDEIIKFYYTGVQIGELDENK
jgi:stage II sporulation protein D